MRGDRIAAGVGEIMQYLVHPYNDNTIRFVLHYPAGVDAQRLAHAALALVRSVDVLHSSFHAGGVKAWWQVHDDVTEKDCFSAMKVNDLRSVAAHSMSRTIRPEDKAQLYVDLFYGMDGDCVVTVSISHLCVDGSDGKYLLYKLAEAYNAPGTLQVKQGNRSATQIYEGLSRKEIRSLMHSPLDGVKTAFPFDSEEEGTCVPKVQTIPAEMMDRARRKAKAMQATANDLLLAACYHALAGTPGIDGSAPMSVMGMMDLRKHCPGGDSPGLSNMVGSLGTTLKHGIGATFEETLSQVALQTRAVKDMPLSGMEGMPLLHGAIKMLPMSVLDKVVGRIYGSFSVGMTNLGSLKSGQLCLGGLAPLSCNFGGPMKKKPAMQVSVISLDGACALGIAGRYPEADAFKLQMFLCRMAGEIADFAGSP